MAYLMTQISTTLGKGESQINHVSIHTHEGNQTDDINLSSKAQVKGRYAHTPKYGQIWPNIAKYGQMWIFGAYLGAPYIW